MYVFVAYNAAVSSFDVCGHNNDNDDNDDDDDDDDDDVGQRSTRSLSRLFVRVVSRNVRALVSFRVRCCRICCIDSVVRPWPS